MTTYNLGPAFDTLSLGDPFHGDLVGQQLDPTMSQPFDPLHPVAGVTLASFGASPSDAQKWQTLGTIYDTITGAHTQQPETTASSTSQSKPSLLTEISIALLALLVIGFGVWRFIK